MRSITIDLPLPPKELHPNARANRWKKAAAAKRARGEACLVARSELVKAGGGPWEAAVWDAWFHFNVHRNRDEDGLVAWLKNYLDGIVTDARLLPADDMRYLRMCHPPLTSARRRGPWGVTITFYEHSAESFSALNWNEDR